MTMIMLEEVHGSAVMNTMAFGIGDICCFGKAFGNGLERYPGRAESLVHHMRPIE